MNNGDAYKYIRFNNAQETRWSTEDEIKRVCTRVPLEDEDYPVAGLPVLCDGKDAYVDGTDTHTLIFGATGSKKTRLFCMPMINMMAKAGESFIVTDPKGELYAQTGGLAKQKGYKTVVLNFRDMGNGDRWNPLGIPYELWAEGEHDEAGILLSDLITIAAHKNANNTNDAYWPEAAQELGIAGLYTLMEAGTKEEANMKSFAILCSHGNVRQLDRLSEMMREDTVAGANFRNTVGLPANNTVAGIVGVLAGMLRPFTVNERLARMLSTTSFDMRQIGREKTAVYVIVPDEKTTYHFIVAMFLKQVYEILIQEAQKEKNRQLPVRVNFVLDEFCNIPKIPDMPSMISAARSRNMRYFLVAQSLHQLIGRYGDDAGTIKGNCDNWVFLTSKELALLNEISELCGTVITPDGQAKRLISSSELQRFDKKKGEALIIHARQYPIVTYLPDISEYEMFGNLEAPVLTRDNAEEPVPCLSVSKLLRKIASNEAVPPFATEEQLIKQATEIYEEEKRATAEEQEKSEKAETEENDLLETDDDTASELNDSHRSALSSMLDRLKKRKAELEAAKTDETIMAKLRGEAEAKAEKARVGEERARARIARLMGEEFADRFFKEELYKSKPRSFLSDDDDDLF